MFKKPTLDEYLDNPMGKGSTAIFNRNLIKSDLDNRYNKLIEKYESFRYYHYNDCKNIYIHIKVPSESKRENTYDVVLKFCLTDPSLKHDISILNYPLEFFSNCPSFTYTYAYVYGKNKLLISFLKDKYTNTVNKKQPVVKNPGEIINYDKSIYFACKFVKENKLLTNKLSFSPFTRRLVIEIFKKSIRSSDDIEKEINEENKKLKKAKNKEEKPSVKTTIKKIVDKPLKNIEKITGTTHKIKPHSKIKAKSKVQAVKKK